MTLTNFINEFWTLIRTTAAAMNVSMQNVFHTLQCHSYWPKDSLSLSDGAIKHQRHD